MLLSAVDMILNIGNAKVSTKILDLINKFSKCARYKINSLKSVFFFFYLHQNKWTVRREKQENNSVQNHIKKNKIPRNKFNQDVKDLYF